METSAPSAHFGLLTQAAMTRRLLASYLLGLFAIVAGAWATELTGSFIPVALGASFSIIRTVSTVKAILIRRRRHTDIR